MGSPNGASAPMGGAAASQPPVRQTMPGQLGQVGAPGKMGPGVPQSGPVQPGLQRFPGQPMPPQGTQQFPMGGQQMMSPGAQFGGKQGAPTQQYGNAASQIQSQMGMYGSPYGQQGKMGGYAPQYGGMGSKMGGQAPQYGGQFGGKMGGQYPQQGYGGGKMGYGAPQGAPVYQQQAAQALMGRPMGN